MRWLTLGVIPLGLVAGFALRTASPVLRERAETVDTITLYERKAMVSVFGELRSSLAAYLWAKTDEYTHGGVRLRPMTEREKRERAAREASSADGMHHHQDETSVIPEPERDPRGFWGDIERQVKPFFDIRHHFHRPVREVLPLYRFMTWIDPTFVPGYLVGAQMLLFDSKKRLPEALAFLKEGARNNPQSIAIFTELGRYALVYLGDHAQAERHFRRAIRNGANWNPQNPFECEGLLHAYRWLAIMKHREARFAERRFWAQQGLTRFPDDPVLQRFAR